MCPLCLFFSPASPASCALSECNFAYHRLITSVRTFRPFTIMIDPPMCGGSREDAILARCPFSPSSFRSFVKKWLLPHQKSFVASSDLKGGVVMGRNANFLMMSAQHLEREPSHSRLGKTRHLHLPLPHLEPSRERAVTPFPEMFATSTGTPVSATADLTVHLNIRKTPTHSPAAPTLPAGLKMKRVLQTLLWDFSQ